MKPAAPAVVVSTLMLAAVPLGCGAESSKATGSSSSTTSTPRVTQSGHGKDAAGTNPCTLFTGQQIDTALGVQVGQPTKNHSFECHWESADYQDDTAPSSALLTVSLFADEPYTGAFDSSELTNVRMITGIGEQAQYGYSGGDLLLRVKEPWGYLQLTLSGNVMSGGSGINFDSQVQAQKFQSLQDPMKDLATDALRKLGA